VNSFATTSLHLQIIRLIIDVHLVIVSVAGNTFVIL